MNEFINYLFGGLYAILLAIGKWYVSSIQKRLDKNEAQIAFLNQRIALNDKNDEAVEKSIEELKSTMLQTQGILNEFLTKYSFVLDKLVEIEKHK